jgi:hypothetical protein
MKHPALAALVALCVLAQACSTPATRSSNAPLPASAHATAAYLAIDGDVADRALGLADLERLGPVEVTWEHKGVSRRYRALPLEALLGAVGVEPGPMGSATDPREKRSGWKFVVVATSADGFQAVFTAAEVHATMGKTRAYLAFEEGGATIPSPAGPFRLVVPTDGEASRSSRDVRRLTVLDVRRIVRPD